MTEETKAEFSRLMSELEVFGIARLIFLLLKYLLVSERFQRRTGVRMRRSTGPISQRSSH